MNRTTKMAVAAALTFLAHSALACDYPERISEFPDGATATRDEMIAGKKAVQSFLGNMESYLSCIEAEEAQALIALGDIDEEAKEQRAATFDKKYNAAVEEMNLVAEEFNIQLRAFNARKK